MSNRAKDERTRWLVAAVGAIGVVAAVLLLFRFPDPPKPQPTPAKPGKSSVQIARPGPADRLLQEEAEMRDLRPLFLPTERNATVPEPQREPGRTFFGEEGIKWSFAEADLLERLPPVATLDGKALGKAEPVDALATHALGGTLLGFGRQRIELAPDDVRGGFVEIVATGTGRPVLALPLAPEARPPVDKAWGPVEFLAAIDAAGLMGPLVVMEGSRVEEVDLHFKNFLTRTFRVGERLDPGFYRITVAP